MQYREGMSATEEAQLLRELDELDAQYAIGYARDAQEGCGCRGVLKGHVCEECGVAAEEHALHDEMMRYRP